MNKQLIFATLGPVGTCHELATQYKIEFQEVANAKIELMKKKQFYSHFRRSISQVLMFLMVLQFFLKKPC